MSAALGTWRCCTSVAPSGCAVPSWLQPGGANSVFGRSCAIFCPSGPLSIWNTRWPGRRCRTRLPTPSRRARAHGDARSPPAGRHRPAPADRPDPRHGVCRQSCPRAVLAACLTRPRRRRRRRRRRGCPSARRRRRASYHTLQLTARPPRIHGLGLGHRRAPPALNEGPGSFRKCDINGFAVAPVAAAATSTAGRGRAQASEGPSAAAWMAVRSSFFMLSTA